MSAETIREAVRADGATVRLARTSYGTLSPTWCVVLMRPTGWEMRTALFESDALRAFDRAAAGGAL